MERWEARVRRDRRDYQGEGTEERGWRREDEGVEGEERNEKVRWIKYKENVRETERDDLG